MIIYQVDSRPADENFGVHQKRAASFKCLQPQPRAIKITDKIRTGVQGKRFVPRMTVLHRCDSGSGCCLQGDVRRECGPVKTEEIELTFQVIHTVGEKVHKVGSSTVKTMVFTNHTECGCKWAKVKPKPFSIEARKDWSAVSRMFSCDYVYISRQLNNCKQKLINCNYEFIGKLWKQ